MLLLSGAWDPTATPLMRDHGWQWFILFWFNVSHNLEASEAVHSAQFVAVVNRQVSCQQHAKLLRSGKEEDRAKAKSVELLMEMHPSLKVSFEK